MRLPDWERRLFDFVFARHCDPFEWGRNDCALFAADAVQAITGTDLAADFRGTYDTALGAARALQSAGGFEALAGAHFGKPIHVRHAKPGDIALIEQEHGPALAVVLGEMVAGPGANGVRFLPLTAAQVAWRV